MAAMETDHSLPRSMPTSSKTAEKPTSTGRTRESFLKNGKITTEPRKPLTEECYIKIVNKAVQEGLREENYQEQERQRPTKNVIIHGMKEETHTES